MNAPTYQESRRGAALAGVSSSSRRMAQVDKSGGPSRQPQGKQAAALQETAARLCYTAKLHVTEDFRWLGR